MVLTREEDDGMKTWQVDTEMSDKERQVKTHKHDGNIDNHKNK